MKNENNKNKTETTQKVKLMRKLTVLQKIPKQRNIQKTFKRPPKEANWKKQNWRRNFYWRRNTYREVIKKDIEKSKTVIPRNTRPNLSKDEKVTLRDLSKRDDIIITNADRCSAVVIMSVNDYIREAKCQVNEKGSRLRPYSN